MSAADDFLQRLEGFAEDFAERVLRSYIRRLSSGSALPRAPKEVNDPIWGTIKLSPLEVVVVDSPLLQRLRFVRQLGVVHWVYPGAGHTRFEHTLGVLHQAQQLINAINLSSGEASGGQPINQNKAGIVRLCALVHDIGHGIFSHVSEHALANRTDLRLALTAFAKKHQVAKVQLSEAVAFNLIGSRAFIEMLSSALDQLAQPINLGGGSHHNAAEICRLAQAAVIGKMIDEEIPLLHEIVTGPFDADKLDYYVRDARHAGVPPILDISRLTQKIAVKRVTARELPTTISAALTSSSDAHYLFGLKWSGVAMLDELHLARVLLYSKVYRHKKVQAVEAMIDALFGALGASPDVDPVKLVELCYRFSDDQFLWSRGADIVAAAGIAPSAPELEAFVDGILCALRERHLFVSALAIRSKYPSDPWAGDEKQDLGLSDLDSDLGNIQKLAKFRRALVEEVATLHEAVPESFGGLEAELVARSVIVAAKPQLGGATEIDRAFILQGQKMVPGRDLDRINQPAWSSAYNFGSPSAIIFCPKECSPAVYVAAERLIRREYGVVLPASAMEMSKQTDDDVIKLKRSAEKAGWYAGTPLDIRALPLRLGKLDISSRLEPVLAKLASFDEPHLAIGQRRASELKGRVVSWLAQFRDDRMIECALMALEKLRILRRDDTQAALEEFIRRNPQFAGATICPLGDLKDSGAVQGYVSLDSGAVGRVFTVEQAADRNEQGPIIFLDDFTASGVQARDILGNWFDEPSLKTSSLLEERLPFSEKERAYLRERELGFVFVAAWSKGLEDFKKALQKLSLNGTVYGHLTDDQLPFAFDGALSQLDPSDVRAFRDQCRHIGEELQRSAEKTGKEVTDRALGYGNRAMLLTSSLNVPTQTLTCLWRDGMVDGVEWHALLRRRSKA